MGPDWKPLEEKLGSLRCQAFMYIGSYNNIHLYLHVTTRRYLNLDDQGRCYLYRDSRYEPADFDVQLSLIEAEASLLKKARRHGHEDNP